MVKEILGRKLRMTQMFSEEGLRIPLTAIEAGPCPVVQIKNKETDGYEAIQIGFLPVKEKSQTKARLGHFEKAGVEPQRVLREIRVDSTSEYEVGKALDCSSFEEGDRVDVTGVSKGRGFQGGMKRYGWHGGKKPHGSMHHRAIGAIAAGTNQGRIFKGKTLPGHMGNINVTTQNIEVVKVDAENNVLYVRGGIPGPNGGMVYVKATTKNVKKKSKA